MYTELIRAEASSVGIMPDVLAGVIIAESSGDPWQVKDEDRFYLTRLLWRSRKDLAGHVPQRLPTIATEKKLRSFSWGLTQVLGETARVLGFNGDWLTQLLDPELNVHYGALYLQQCMQRAKRTRGDNITDYREALLGYNGGGDKAYPDRVFRAISTGMIGKVLR